MKKYLFIFFLPLTGLLNACSKGDSCPTVTTSVPAGEVSNLRAYIQSNSISASEDSRGFFYTISDAGSNSKPSTCSSVTVNYIGKFTTGITFDQNNNVTFPLSQLILGWQEGIPLIGTGGKITLYLPPSLGYGSKTVGSIPANSNLVFTIDLIAIQ